MLSQITLAYHGTEYKNVFLWKTWDTRWSIHIAREYVMGTRMYWWEPALGAEGLPPSLPFDGM